MSNEEPQSGRLERLQGPFSTFVTFIKDLLPIMTVIIGGLWAVFTYLDDKRHAETLRSDEWQKQQTEFQQQIKLRALEARKPYVEKQFALFVEVAQLIGKVVEKPRDDAEWKTSVIRLVEISEGDIVLVDDSNVGTALRTFMDSVAIYQALPNSQISGPRLSLAQQGRALSDSLGHAIRASWRID